MKRWAALILLGFSLTAFADEVSHRKLADELMGLTQAEAAVRNWRKRFEAQAQEAVDEVTQGRRPEQLSESQRQAVRRFNERGAAALDSGLNWTQLREPLQRLYMETFTEAETRELIAFFKTSTGQKMLVGLPALSEGIARTVRGQIDSMRPQLQGISQRFQAEYAMAASVAPAARAADSVFDKPAASPTKPAAKAACTNPKTGQSCS